MDISAVVLNKLLAERNLEIWARLKLVFLDPAFSSLYVAIQKHYDLYSTLPSFEELELSLRQGVALQTLAIVKLVEADEISAEVALDALLDQYTQNEAIRELDKYIDKLPLYTSEEIRENLAAISLRLDEKTLTTEGVYNMADIMLFKDAEDLARDRVHLGLNNKFDAVLAGVARQELILLGGPRGSGKSINCSNIQINQYESGNVCPYFTIEMIAHEVMERNLAILSNISHQSLKQGKLTDEELLRVVKARAGMFVDADDLVQKFMRTKDKFKFESELVRTKSLKPDNQMIIIDDRALSLTSLDLHMGKIKSKFGDKFKVCVVDYLNQIIVDGSSNGTHDMFDWKQQVVVSKRLKELARKHDVVVFSPYQVDANGEARFAKGILDAADIALLTKVHEKDKGCITYETTKIRGGSEMTFTSGIDWSSLRISPIEMEQPAEEGKEKTKIKNAAKKSKNEELKQDDAKADIPWET